MKGKRTLLIVVASATLVALDAGRAAAAKVDFKLRTMPVSPCPER